MMWSMWNAPSDRDYYGSDGRLEEEDYGDQCLECGASGNLACQEWCKTRQIATEPAPTNAPEATL